jgi:hypothetical protein
LVGDGLVELAALIELCDVDAAGLGVPFAVDPVAEFTLPMFDPAEEFVLAALFEPVDEFALPDLLEAADKFVLPGFDLVFELPDELALSRADEFLLPV